MPSSAKNFRMGRSYKLLRATDQSNNVIVLGFGEKRTETFGGYWDEKAEQAPP